MSRSRLVIPLIAIAAAARCVFLTWLHRLSSDETEFFRATDWVAHGLVPYRDFWEHHTPLQWFLFAPIASAIESPGVRAVVALRWAQVPLWAVTLWLLSVWMRRAGISTGARLSAILLLVCSAMFATAAAEYRVDSLGCALYILALVLLQNADRSFWIAAAGGAVLCFTGFANLRMGPLLALTVLVTRVVRPRDRSWGGATPSNGVFVGVAGGMAAGMVYFIVTHSAAIAFRRLWSENYLADSLSEGTKWIFLRRLAQPFGLQVLVPSERLFDLQTFDIATVILVVMGLAGVLSVLFSKYRAPDAFFLLAFLQLGNVLFIAAMKFVYEYHFEAILLLMVPFVAAQIDRFAVTDRRWNAVVASLLVVSSVSVFVSLFRGKEDDLRYQDLVMRDADRHTAPGAAVFDGAGWALRRRPAYQYWFLSTIVENLERHGIFAPYTLRQMAADPPGAIITDYRTFGWLLTHPSLASFATAHYLPFRLNLWLPGLSARLTAAARTAQWIVPQSGEYRIYASQRLALHPWFLKPLIFGTFPNAHTEMALTGFPPAAKLPLSWTVDGVPMRPGDGLTLQKGHALAASLRGDQPLGLMIVPAGIHALFQQPPRGATLIGTTMPSTHVPRFPEILYSQ